MADRAKPIRISLEDGIVTFGTEYEIGARLEREFNFVHKYIPMKNGVFFSYEDTSWEPMRPDPDTYVEPDNCSFIGGAEKFENGAINASGVGYLFGGARSSDTKLGLWNQTGSAELTAGTLAAGVGRWSIAHFSSLTPPTTYLTEPSLVAMKKTVDRVTFTNWAPTGFVGIADHLNVHQGRVFLAQGKYLYYTDVFDPNNVRQFGLTNPFVLPSNINGFGKIGISEIDPGAQSHLFVGLESECWVLDGTPGAGNEVLRRLTQQVGILGESDFVSVDKGLSFVGTDRVIYLVTLGGVGEPVPIGHQVRDITARLKPTLVWRRPYLVVFLESMHQYLLCDLRADRPVWTGIHQANDFLLDRYRNLFFTHRFPVHDYIWVAGTYDTGGVAQLAKLQDPHFDIVWTPQQKLVVSGINEPGHEVEWTRMLFSVKQGSVAKVFTVLTLDSFGRAGSRSFTVPIGNEISELSVAPLGANGTRGDWIKVTLVCNGQEAADDLGMSALRTWEIHYNTIPRFKV